MKNLRIRFRLNDLLFMMAMTFVLAFPNPSAFKAVSILLFFFNTVLSYFSFSKKRTLVLLLLHTVWALTFSAFCYSSRLWSFYPAAASDVMMNVLWSLMLSIAIVNYIVHDKLSVTDIARRLLLIGILLLINIIVNGTFIEGRLTLVTNRYVLNENTFGQIAVGIAVFLLYWCRSLQWKNMFLNLSLVLSAALALSSGSRKSLLTLALYAVAFLLYEYPSEKLMKSTVKFLSLLLLAGAGYLCLMHIDFLYTSIGYRIESLLAFVNGDLSADGSANTRFLMMQTALEMFLAKPLLGYGLNVFTYVTSFGTYTHNNYFELLANTGLVGLLIYYIPLLIFFTKAYHCWKNRLKDAIVPLAGILMFLINDLAQVSYFSMVTHVFLAFSIGLCINALQSQETGGETK